MGKGLTLQVTMVIKPELREEYLAALREFMVHARQEPGCIFLYASEAADEHGNHRHLRKLPGPGRIQRNAPA